MAHLIRTLPMSRVLFVSHPTIDHGRLFPVEWHIHPLRVVTDYQREQCAAVQALMIRKCQLLHSAGLILHSEIRDDNHIAGQPHPGSRPEMLDHWQACNRALPKNWARMDDMQARTWVHDPRLDTQ